MTTITLKDSLIEKLVAKWKEEHPDETPNTRTKVIEKICINYLNKNKKNE